MVSHVTYKNAPLIELIVEVRWPVQTIGIPSGPPIVAGASAAFDVWFQNLSNVLRNDGFTEIERLTPHDAPAFAHQPIFRYKRPNERFPICQFGHGIFTINAGPPNYISWDNFRPQVKKGLDALIENKPEAAEIESFTTASLRYIDVFKEDLREGQSNFSFMKNTLGVSVELPGNLLDYADDEDEITPHIAIKMPLKNRTGTTLNFQLAAGRVGSDTESIDSIMDTTYSFTQSLPFSSDTILEILDDGYTVLHHWFEKLTKNIHYRMNPVSDE